MQANAENMGNANSGDVSQADSSDDGFADTIVMPAESRNSDNVGDASVEINVEQLVAEIEASQAEGADAKAAARRRLEDIMEQKRIEEALSDFDDISLDD